jgi:hypothetical protein
MANPLKFYRKNTCTVILEVCDYQFHEGDTIYFTVKTKPDSDETDSDALIKEEWVYGTDVEANENGSLNLIIPANKTDIAYGDYFYDIKLVTDSQSPAAENTLAVGTFTIMDVATLRA